MVLSSRVKGLKESVTLKLNEKAQKMAREGKRVLNLTAGQLPFKPDPRFIEKMREQMHFLNSFQYSPVPGFFDLRKKFLDYFEKSRNIKLETIGVEFDCIISNGGKHSIYNVLGAIVEPGDEVVLFSPFWVSYPEMIKFWGATPVVVSTDRFNAYTPSISELRKILTPNTKAIIINSPNNPSGTKYSEQWMEEFADLLLEYPDLLILSDEIYFELNYFDPKPVYYYQKHPELLKRTIIVDGISKSFACTGLRIGFCIGPKHITQAVNKIQSQTTSGANSLIQKALADFDFSLIEEFVEPIRSHLRTNANYIRAALKEHNLSSLWYQPAGAFYFMIDFSGAPIFEQFKKKFPDKSDLSNEICELLLEEMNLAIVPGTDFGQPNSARMSLVSEIEVFKEAMDKICEFLSQR